MTIYPQGKVPSNAANNGRLPVLTVNGQAQLVYEIIFAPDPTATGKTYVAQGVPDLTNYTNILRAFPPYPTTAVADSCAFRIKDGADANLLNPAQFNVGGANGVDGLLVTYVVK